MFAQVTNSEYHTEYTHRQKGFAPSLRSPPLSGGRLRSCASHSVSKNEPTSQLVSLSTYGSSEARPFHVRTARRRRNGEHGRFFSASEVIPHFFLPHRTPALSSFSTSIKRASASPGPCLLIWRSNARMIAEPLIDRPRKSVASWLSRWRIAASAAERVTL
jgi:hypothetical protein